jgi:hypothetical protein
MYQCVSAYEARGAFPTRAASRRPLIEEDVMNHTHQSRTHDKKTKHRKPAKTATKKSTPPDARPTAKMPTRHDRQHHENEPPRNWDYADANAPEGQRNDTGAGQKTAAPTSVGRVYGGENNVTLPTSEKAARAATAKDNQRVQKPANAQRSDDDEAISPPTRR